MHETTHPRMRDLIQHELFVAHLHPEKPFTELIHILGNKNVPKSLRFQAGVMIGSKPFKRIGIDPMGIFHRSYYDATQTPVQKAPPLLAYGVENFVFLLEGEKRKVLKVDKISLNKPLAEQMTRAKELKSNYTQIAEWFKDVKGFVVPSSFFIGRMPYRNQVAVGIVQPFIQEGKGLFEDFTDSQLTSLFSQDPAFRRDFISMSQTILIQLSDSDKSIDFSGKKNISVIENNGSHRLVLMDSCDIKDLKKARKNKRKKHFIRNFSKRAARLELLQQHARGLVQST